VSTVLTFKPTFPQIDFSVVTKFQNVDLQFPIDPLCENLVKIQTGNFINSAAPDLSGKLSEYYTWHWQRCERLGAFDLAADARILDLGSGLGILDIIAAKILPESRFWLVDQNDFTYDPAYYVRHGSDHPYYNSWPVVEELLTANQLARQRFVLQPPDSPWPQDLDLVISTWCWCWHLPFEMYWPQVLQSLRIGGRLCMDIRIDHLSVVPMISEALGQTPVMSAYQGFIGETQDQTLNRGARYVWQRQR
jgi:hypothetical protein